MRGGQLRLLQQNNQSFDAIAYNRGESLAARLRNGSRVAAVFTPRINTWNGMTQAEAIRRIGCGESVVALREMQPPKP